MQKLHATQKNTSHQKKKLLSAHHGTSSSDIPTAFLTHHGPPSAKRHIDHGANIVSRAVVVFVVVVDAE
jgi:hypothetical protein